MLRLIQSAAGAPVTGIKAVGIKSDDSENGYKLTVNAKAVVMSTGGFARNSDMMTKYHSDYSGYTYNCCSASTGEGVQMGVDAGSKVECQNEYCAGFMSSKTYFELALMHLSTPGIMVDAYGKNVGNITSNNHAKMSELARTAKEPGDAYYYVFDESSLPSNNDYKAYGFTTYKALENRGQMQTYASIAAAAAALKLDGLKDAIDANNAAALAGKKDEFGRKNCPYIDDRQGLHVVPVIPTLYLSTSGLCIDNNGHVLTDSWNMDNKNSNVKIPGFYACGDVCGSIETKDGKEYGMGFDMAMGFGYVVASTIEADGISKS